MAWRSWSIEQSSDMYQERTLTAIVGNALITAVDWELGMPMRRSEATEGR